MFFKRLFSWCVGLPLAIVLICFAIANRHWSTVSFDPVNTTDPWLSISMPVFLIFFAGVFLGIIAGGCVVWWRQGKWRKAARIAREGQQSASPSQSNKDNAQSTANPLVPALRQ